MNVEPFPERAFELDRAAEHLRQAPANRQAQAGSAVAARRRAVELPEILEHLRLILAGDADPAVGHRYRDGPRPSHRTRALIVTVPAGVNFSALLRKLRTICLTFWRSLLNAGSDRRHVGTHRQVRAPDDRLELRHHLFDELAES